MKYLKKIYESLNVYGLSWDESNNIKKLITSIINNDLNYQKIKIEGLGDFVQPLSWEDPNKRKSILNYANTNKLLLNELCKRFNINTYESLYKFIEENKNELFVKGGKYFNIVINCLNNTIKVGEMNEEYAKKFIENNWKDKGCSVRRTETDYYDDLVLGIDLYFTIEGGNREYSVQVKPLKSIIKKDNVYQVESAGVIKEYKIDYYIFVDRNNDKLAMFKNRKVSINRNTFLIDETSFVLYKE